jgi:hypothetical protein
MSLWTRTPEPEPVLPPAHVEPIHLLPRMGGGLCWSDLTREIAAEQANRQADHDLPPEEGAA